MGMIASMAVMTMMVCLVEQEMTGLRDRMAEIGFLAVMVMIVFMATMAAIAFLAMMVKII